jgi:hypothetical protein
MSKAIAKGAQELMIDLVAKVDIAPSLLVPRVVDAICVEIHPMLECGLPSHLARILQLRLGTRNPEEATR